MKPTTNNQITENENDIVDVMKSVDNVPGKQEAVTNQADGFLFKYCLCCVAATVAETFTYPLDLTKTRLQIQGEIAALPGRSGKSSSVVYRGMLQTAYGVVREEGLPKLWQGITPAICRHVVYTGGRMATYEWVRDHIFGKNTDGTFAFWKAVLSGMSAGAFAQFLANPTDLIKVQMQMEGRRRLQGKPPRVKNSVHAFMSILKRGGVPGLWKGWAPNVQRAALVNLGDLTTYDTAKHNILVHTRLKDNHVTHTIASACSGLMSAVLGTPADVIKTRVMNQPLDENGRPLLYKSSLDCLMKTVRGEGVIALYKGFLPIWARMAPWSLTFWLVYEQVRNVAGSSSF